MRHPTEEQMQVLIRHAVGSYRSHMDVAKIGA